MFLFAGLMALFPRFLPKKHMSRNMALAAVQQQTKEALSKDERPLTTGTSFKVEPLPGARAPSSSSAHADEKPSLKGAARRHEGLPWWGLEPASGRNIMPLLHAAFPAALMRLLRNKLLVCNIWSGIFYILGGSAYITFITKYLEVQFQQSSAKASMVTG